ncbi:MAG TPA: TolC family outer membrane protein [Burkholderiaceae bacterium]|nr:TolC family outer membrane protein [Burkholderiaceae bacterium]
MNAKVYLAAALACATSLSWADNLSAIYDKAAQRDPVFASARRALEIVQERLPQARAGLLPTVSLNSGVNRQLGEASFNHEPFVERGVRNWSWNLQLNQPLWRKANWVAYDQAQSQLEVAQAQFKLAQQDLMLRAAQAYFDVLTSQESLRVAQAQVSAVQLQLELAKRNFEVGVATVTDVHEATARNDLSRAQQVVALNDLEVKRAELQKLLGEMIPPLASLRPEISLPRPLPENAQTWATDASLQNPLVHAQLAAWTVARKEVDKSHAAHWPTLDLVASRGNSFASGALGSPANIATRVATNQIGLQLNVPLYAGGGVQAKVREAAAAAARAHDDLEAARRQVAAAAQQAFSGVVNGHAQIEALASAVRSSKSAVDANKIGYRIGTRINIDVLNAEQQLYAAQRDLFKARAETILQGLRLKAAAGILEEADLRAVDQLLTEAEAS